MPKPVIDGVGPNLKKSGTSHVWIYGENLADGDAVKIKSKRTGATWAGTLKNPDPATGGPGIKQKARADVKKTTDDDDDEAVPVTTEDFADITVTVTNSTGPQQLDDQAVIDGP